MKLRVHKLLKVINLAHLLGGVWLLSIARFLDILLFKRDSDFFSGTYSTVLVLTVLTGLFAFCGSLILYLVHYLFLRKKPHLGTPRSVRRGFLPMVTVGILLMIAIGAISVRGAYLLGQANTTFESSPPTSQIPPVETVNKVKPNPLNTAPPTVQETQTKNNLVACPVYGQTFNLTPEQCRYYQQEEAGGNKEGSTYTPPITSGNSQQTVTPIPTSSTNNHSYQYDCEKKCDATYKYYPETSQFKKECYQSCKGYPPY
jgi:hypothetical protein